MLESQLSTLPRHVVASRRCPQCEAATAIQRATPGRSGFEHWTLRCPKCGNSETQVQTDSMKSEAVGWLSGDLHAPT